MVRRLLAWSRGDLNVCAAASTQAEAAAPHAGVQTSMDRLHLRWGQWPDAERASRQALALDSDSAEAHHGMDVTPPWQAADRSPVAGARSRRWIAAARARLPILAPGRLTSTAMSTLPERYFTAEECLLLEERSPYRSQYIHGEIYP